MGKRLSQIAKQEGLQVNEVLSLKNTSLVSNEGIALTVTFTASLIFIPGWSSRAMTFASLIGHDITKLEILCNHFYGYESLKLYRLYHIYSLVFFSLNETSLILSRIPPFGYQFLLFLQVKSVI